MKGLVMDFPLTLVHVFERATRLFPAQEIVSRKPDRSLHRYRYDDFSRRTRSLISALQTLGLRQGDVVGTLMWNHWAHLESYFGVPLAGGVVHTLNLRLPPNDLAYIINHARDRFLIVDDVLLPLLAKVREHTNFEKVIVVRHTPETLPEGFLDYESILAGAPPFKGYPSIAEDDALGICYTSGTTGRPKGTVYSHRAMVLHSLVESMPDSLNLSHQDTCCPVVPMFHANAWGLPYACTLVGSKQCFPGPHLDCESLLELFSTEKVTFTAGVPTIWMGILKFLQTSPDRWPLQPGLRMAIGGSAAPESMIREFDKFGCRILHAWGMTETGPLGTLSFLKQDVKGAGDDTKYALRAKQGLPVPLIEVRARGTEGDVPWDGESVGELEVRGSWVSSGYLHDTESGDRWTGDGWFRTGDVVTIDPLGYMKITDRTKDLIKSGGEWISSVDMENLLMSHPGVAEAAVIAIPDPKWVERPLAVVVPHGEPPPIEDLKNHLSSRFAKWALPDDFVFVKEIPRTSTGKFSKLTLREQFKDHGGKS